MTTISDAERFGSLPSHIDDNNNVWKKTNEQTAIDQDELIITQPEHSKTLKTTKNGRYISRIIDSVTKMQTRDEFSDHDKALNNLSLYWYIRTLLVSNSAYDDSAAQSKLFDFYALLNKFDRESDDYSNKLIYVYNMLESINKIKFDELGISPENFMYKNLNEFDGIGLSTFSKDIYHELSDLAIKSDIPEDMPEKKLPMYPEITEDISKIITQPVPKILHILYYKKKIDLQYLYVHLASYTANRDYTIMVWMHKYPDHGLRSNDHIIFKTFDGLKYGNYSKHADDGFTWEWDDKFKLKYYILKEFGGIYTDYNIAGLKKFNQSIVSSSFVSVFSTNYKDQRYICPLVFFMGFPPNHPYVDYIIENFKDGADICQTEYIYLRSALINAQDTNIKLLAQNPENKSSNVSYIELRDKEFKESQKYFEYKDFDSPDDPPDAKAIDAKAIEGTDGDKPVINDDDSSKRLDDAIDLMEAERKELEEMERVVNKITVDDSHGGRAVHEVGYENGPYFWVCLFGFICAYYATYNGWL